MNAKKSTLARLFPFSWRDFFITAGIMICAIEFCILLRLADSSDGFSSPVFVLAVLLISRLTNGYLFGLLASVSGVICVNFIFTYPFLAFNFTISGYPLTFLTFLMVSIISSALTTQTKQQEILRIENEKERIRANLLRSVSHDIRTPLTSIMGATSVILDNPSLPVAEQTELLHDIHNESQWLIRIVENLLSITRIGDTRAQIHKDPEMAEEILGEAVRKFRKHYTGITLSVQAPNDPLFVPMDSILIEQVLANLLENAATHGKTTTKIDVAVAVEGSLARFSVADNGQGIAPEAIPTLFDGTLKENETSSGDGKRNMGLGLSVCLAIIRAHDGTLEAKNNTVGAEFFFCLPLSEEVS